MCPLPSCTPCVPGRRSAPRRPAKRDKPRATQRQETPVTRGRCAAGRGLLPAPRRSRRQLRSPDPRRAGLPAARGALQGHRSGACAMPTGFRAVVDGPRGARREQRRRQGGRNRGPRISAGGAGGGCAPGSAWCPVRKAGQAPRHHTCEWTTPSSTAPPPWKSRPTRCSRGDRVLIIDDVLATGGTAPRGRDLLADAGAVVTGLAVLLELEALGGRHAGRRCRSVHLLVV